MGAAATTSLRRAALLVLCVCAVSACTVSPGIGRIGGWEHRIDDKTELWGEYHPQGVYELQRDVFLIDDYEYTNGPALVAGMETPVSPGTFRGPTGISDYQADPKRYRTVTDVVPMGTRLRVETLRGKGNLRDQEATIHYVKGRLLDGKYRGWLVDLQPLSRYVLLDPESRKETLVGPNEDFLVFAP